MGFEVLYIFSFILFLISEFPTVNIYIVGRIMTFQRCPRPHPQSLCICEVTRQKGIKLKLLLLLSWPGEREIILDNPGGLNVITPVFKCGGGRAGTEQWCPVKKTPPAAADARGPGAQKCWWLLEAGKGKKMGSLLKPPKKEWGLPDTFNFSPVRATLGFGPAELEGDEFGWF